MSDASKVREDERRALKGARARLAMRTGRGIGDVRDDILLLLVDIELRRSALVDVHSVTVDRLYTTMGMLDPAPIVPRRVGGAATPPGYHRTGEDCPDCGGAGSYPRNGRLCRACLGSGQEIVLDE